MKRFIFLAMILASLFNFISCSDDNDNPTPPTPPVAQSRGAYIINQGNYYSHIPGSISYLNTVDSTVTDSVFLAANGVQPGNTLQQGLVYGSHFYAIAYESNVFFACDKSSLHIQKELQVDAPRAMAAAGKYIYISNYSGTVTRIDTTTMSIDGTVSVGPNPEELTVQGDYLYVTNSDGLNYTKGYENGKSVSKISLSSFQVVKTIPVGLNPTKIKSASDGNIYLVAMGNYGATPAKIQRISPDDQVTDMMEATMFDVHGNYLYAINSVTDWKTYETKNTFIKYDLRTGTSSEDFIFPLSGYPIAINIEPVSGDIYITNFNAGAYGADYSGDGYVCRYSNADGKLLGTYNTGVNAVQLVFVY